MCKFLRGGLWKYLEISERQAGAIEPYHGIRARRRTSPNYGLLPIVLTTLHAKMGWRQQHHRCA